MSRKLTLSSLQTDIIELRKLVNEKLHRDNELKTTLSHHEETIKQLQSRPQPPAQAQAPTASEDFQRMQAQIYELKKRLSAAPVTGSQPEVQPAVSLVDTISKPFLIPLDGKLAFNTDTNTLELFFNGSWYSVGLVKSTPLDDE